MIKVMLYVNIGTPSPSSFQTAEMYKIFNGDIVGSIIPYVENIYRAIPKRANLVVSGQ
jgi:hypothetical protein